MVTFLGRDGHRLTNLANLKYWGMHFVIIGGDGVQLLGGIYTPHPPLFRHRWLLSVKCSIPMGHLLRTSAKTSDFQTSPLPLSGFVRIFKLPPSDVRTFQQLLITQITTTDIRLNIAAIFQFCSIFHRVSGRPSFRNHPIPGV